MVIIKTRFRFNLPLYFIDEKPRFFRQLVGFAAFTVYADLDRKPPCSLCKRIPRGNIIPFSCHCVFLFPVSHHSSNICRAAFCHCKCRIIGRFAIRWYINYRCGFYGVNLFAGTLRKRRHRHQSQHQHKAEHGAQKPCRRFSCSNHKLFTSFSYFFDFLIDGMTGGSFPHFGGSSTLGGSLIFGGSFPQP